MTFDTWMSLVRDPFIGVTAHYISAPNDNPQKWELKSEQLAFTPLVGDHSGANIGSILIETLDTYGIHEKVTYTHAHIVCHTDYSYRPAGLLQTMPWTMTLPLNLLIRLSALSGTQSSTMSGETMCLYVIVRYWQFDCTDAWSTCFTSVPGILLKVLL